MKRTKRRRGRGRGRHRGRRTPPAERLQAFLKAHQDRLKPATIALLSAVAGALLIFFALRGDTNALYVLLLASGALLLFLGALPNGRLGLTAVFLYTQPLLIYLGNTEYGYTKAIYSLGFISLLWVLWAGEAALRGRMELRLPPLLGPGVAVLGAALLSLINGNSFLADAQYIVLVLYFAAFAFYLANTLRELREIRFLVGALLGAAALASLYGLLQYYGILPGKPGTPHGTGAIISTFGNKNYLGGFLAYLFAPGLALLYGSPSPRRRGLALGALGLVFATLVAVNSDSAWLAVLLSLTAFAGGVLLARAWGPVRGGARAHGSLVALCALLTLLLLLTTAAWLWHRPLAGETWARFAKTFSPLGWLGLGALGGLLGLTGLPALGERLRARGLAPRRVGVGAALLALAILAGAVATPPGRAVVEALQAQAVKSSAKIRAQDWWIAYHMFREQPLVGTGLGDYKREFLPYKAKFLKTERGQRYAERVGYIQRAAQAHNEYVQILAEMGLVGLLAVAAFLGVLIRSAWKILQKNADSPEKALWTAGLAAGLVAFLSDSTFSFPLHLPANALAFVFLLGALFSRALSTGREVTLGRRGTRALAVMVGLIALTVSFFAYRDWRADTYLDRGMRLAKLGENEAAKRLLETSVKLDLAPTEALYWLGAIALREGDVETARDYFERMLPRFTTESGYYQLALAYFQLGEYEKSREYVDLLLSMDPSPDLRPDALYLQAVLLSRTEGPEAAVSRLRELLRQYPQEEKFWVVLAQLYLAQGDSAQAKEAFEKALEVVNRKLQALDRKLQPGREVPLDDYARWSAERKSLRQLRDELEQALRKLSGNP